MNVTAATWDQAVIAESRIRPVIVDAWAEWCGPCRMLGPILDQVEADLAGKVALAKIDTQAESDLAGRLGVSSIPDVRLYRDGVEVDRFVGLRPKQAILEWLTPWLPSPGDDAATAAEAALEAGDLAAAKAQAVASLAADPDHRRALAVTVRCDLANGELAAARSRLDHLRRVPAGAALAEALSRDLGAAEEAAAVSGAAPDSPEGRYAAALAAAARKDDAHALDLLLALVQSDKSWRDGAPRARMVEIFDRRGKGDALVEDYRRKLAMALY